MADETPNTLTELADKLAAATAEIGTLKTTYAAAEAAWGEERAGLSVGLDAEGLRVARQEHGALPAEGKPAFNAWLPAIKADPTKAPRALSPWFAAPSSGGAAAGAAGAAAGAGAGAAAGAPLSSAGTGLPAPGGEGNQSVDAVIQRAVKSGDWTEYNKIRGSLLRPGK